MPNTESAKKSVRKTVKRNALNRWRKSKVRGAMKEFLQTLQAGNVEEAEQKIGKVYKVLDQAGTSNAYHKNTTSRYKSRLTKRLNALKARKASA